MAADVLDVVEAAYRLEGDEASWLGGLAASARPHLGAGLGVSAYLVRNAPGDGAELLHYVQTADDPALEQAARRMIAETPPLAAEVFYRTPLGCSASVETAGDMARDHYRRLGGETGIKDLVGVVGLVPGACAVTIAAPQRSEVTLHPRTRGRWNRVAAHLTAALRLRLRLERVRAADDAEAVLDPDGRVLHLAGAARDASLQDVLRARVRAIERARGPMRHEQDEALAMWKALCAGRWSLIETFDSDGRRLMVACRNEPAAAGSRALTLRERQVISFAALGHGDALIGYALDLAEETAREHLRSAMRKLGVRSRLDLIRLVHALAGGGPADGGDAGHGDDAGAPT